ncbi:MAG: tyrosine-type recombinase/integrase [Bacteroidetes bacterium]|nr:tyrosine-type recombinase/integrase [Bacteroidota bacterium]
MCWLSENLKHKCILSIIYSAGLRVSEAISLKVKDIDSDRGMIIIRQSKGKKDRISLLSNKILLLLRTYYSLYKPKEYLFEGSKGGKYTSSSIHKIVKKAANEANITKTVSTHTLRHSFATHLLEQGVSLRYIQTILGHESSKTTEIYTHVSSTKFNEINNPFDDMDI